MQTETISLDAREFTGEAVPAGDSTVALLRGAGTAYLGYYNTCSSVPVTLYATCYGPGKPKAIVQVDGGPRVELPPGPVFTPFKVQRSLQMEVSADAGGAKYGWVQNCEG